VGGEDFQAAAEQEGKEQEVEKMGDPNPGRKIEQHKFFTSLERVLERSIFSFEWPKALICIGLNFYWVRFHGLR
jgi:hypothetical protein